MRLQDYPIRTSYADAPGKAAVLGIDGNTEVALFALTDIVAYAIGTTLDPFALSVQQLQNKVNALTAGSPEALDTFLEVLNRFLNDENAVAALTRTVNAKANSENARLTGISTSTTSDTTDQSDRIATTQFVYNVLAQLQIGTIGLQLIRANTTDDVANAIGVDGDFLFCRANT